jgi:hypothetical protein
LTSSWTTVQGSFHNEVQLWPFFPVKYPSYGKMTMHCFGFVCISPDTKLCLLWLHLGNQLHVGVLQCLHVSTWNTQTIIAGFLTHIMLILRVISPREKNSDNISGSTDGYSCRLSLQPWEWCWPVS